MSEMFRCGLYTKQQISELKTIQTLWRLLDDPLIAPLRFDTIEDAQIPFTSQSYDEAANMYEDEGVLFVKGRRASFLGSFSRQSEKLATWNFFIDLKVIGVKNEGRWLQWFFSLCNLLPALYGFGCSIAEYDAKHRIVTSLPGGGRVTEWAGVATAEFGQYLSGIYWLTIFGPELVRAFGKDRLMALPDVTAFSLDSEQIALRLNEPAQPMDMARRLAAERNLAEQIGGQYFFDSSQPDRRLKSIPQLVEALNQ